MTSKFNESAHPRSGDGKWSTKDLGETDPELGVDVGEAFEIASLVNEAEKVMVLVSDAASEWEASEPPVEVVHGYRWDNKACEYREFGVDAAERIEARPNRFEPQYFDTDNRTPGSLSVEDFREWYGYDPEAAADDGYDPAEMWSFDREQLKNWYDWNAHLSELRSVAFSLGSGASALRKMGGDSHGADKVVSETLERAGEMGFESEDSVADSGDTLNLDADDETDSETS